LYKSERKWLKAALLEKGGFLVDGRGVLRKKKMQGEKGYGEKARTQVVRLD